MNQMNIFFVYMKSNKKFDRVITRKNGEAKY